jgi:hypothetical protein
MRLRSPRNSKTRSSLTRRKTFKHHDSPELLPWNRRGPLREADELLAAMCQLTSRSQRLGNVLVETELQGHRRLAPHLVRRAAEASHPLLQAPEVRELVHGVRDRVHQAPEVRDLVRGVRDPVPPEHGAPLQERRAHGGPHRVS